MGDEGERELLDQPPVRVTTKRVVVGGTSYALANITSVSHFIEPKAAGLLGLGILILGAGLVMMFAGADFVPTACAIIIGMLCIFGWVKTKQKHWVKLGTAGAETNAVFSFDPAWTSRVVVAINEAIISRS